MQKTAVVIGSGMGSLTTACLLAKAGLKVKIIEQNYLPGGCTSSYWRKGFIFESGATTLVGLDENMPLQFLLDEIGVNIQAIRLELPMKVYLKNGKVLRRYENLEEWIVEAEQTFGHKNQRQFWEFCYKMSQFVWETSLKQTAFPPTRFSDFWHAAKNSNLKQFRYAGYSFFSMEWLLKRYQLLDNQDFVDFVNEQLLITAQNHISEVNVLFGATALCYTNFPNYYVSGGLINLVKPLLDYIKSRDGELLLRERVESITQKEKTYQVKTNKDIYESDFLISGIPINNTLEVYKSDYTEKKAKKLLKSPQLNSAFQMGIAFRVSEEEKQQLDCIHHQIHLEKPLAGVGSSSIFLSLSHPLDNSRSDKPKHRVASISTHLPQPETHILENKKATEDMILDTLDFYGFIRREEIVYKHSSTQKSWEKWTGRAYGFVGGYPQFMKIKPWQMLSARLDNKKAYLCGDTAYPGQGIPGTVLSGIIAFEKLKKDWL